MIARTLAHLPASFASVALLLNPVSATVWAWIILSEPAGWPQVIGGVIVLTGIVLARSRRTNAAAEQPA
jgi:drug/metabolite transporter (DMT)-like permease